MTFQSSYGSFTHLESYYGEERTIVNSVWFWTQLIGSAIRDIVDWFLGGFDGILYTLIAIIVVNYIIGVLTSILRKKFSESIGLSVFISKLAILLLVGIGHLIDLYLLENGATLRTAIIIFYISTEGISLLEDASNIGLPIPQILKRVFEQVRSRSGEDHDDKDDSDSLNGK